MFGNFTISINKRRFFKGRSCFKHNDLGLVLGIALKFYSMAKGLKINVPEVLGLIPTFGEVIKGKMVGRDFFLPSPELD